MRKIRQAEWRGAWPAGFNAQYVTAKHLDVFFSSFQKTVIIPPPFSVLIFKRLIRIQFASSE